MSVQSFKHVLYWHILSKTRKPVRSSLCRMLTLKFEYRNKPLKEHHETLLKKQTQNIVLNFPHLFSTGNKRDTNEDDKEENRRKMPLLMNGTGPPVFMPSVIQTLKSMFFATVIIKPYFDSEFIIKDFVEGAKQAISFVSSHLSSGKWDALDGLITPEALVEIKKNYVKLNLAERQSLEVKKEDLKFTFMHQIGIILNDDSSQRFAEILVVCHVYQNILNDQDLSENEDKLSLCNYRFRRDFTKGIDGMWIINELNHYRAIDFKP